MGEQPGPSELQHSLVVGFTADGILSGGLYSGASSDISEMLCYVEILTKTKEQLLITYT